MDKHDVRDIRRNKKLSDPEGLNDSKPCIVVNHSDCRNHVSEEKMKKLNILMLVFNIVAWIAIVIFVLHI